MIEEKSSDRQKNNNNASHWSRWCWCCGERGNWFAWFLIGFGGYLLLRDLGFIPGDISAWSIVFIALGVIFLIRRKK